MWCDIHSFAEVRKNNRWEKVWDVFKFDPYCREKDDPEYTCHPFFWRNYGIFWFLWDVRNMSESKFISDNRWLPDDVCQEIKDEFDPIWWDHSESYIFLKELLDFDYSEEFIDRRPYYGQQAISYNDFLWTNFFDILEELKQIWDPKNVRIVFWFDN